MKLRCVVALLLLLLMVDVLVAQTPIQVSGTVTITITATEPPENMSSLANLAITTDGNPCGATSTPGPSPATFSCMWDTTKVGNGPHTIGASASDAAGASGTGTQPVNVLNLSPIIIQFTSPHAGMPVTGSKVQVGANATDPTSPVTSMSLFIQGKQVATSKTGQISYKWNSSPYKFMTVPLTATAADKTGATGSITITVPVQ